MIFKILEVLKNGKNYLKQISYLTEKEMHRLKNQINRIPINNLNYLKSKQNHYLKYSQNLQQKILKRKSLLNYKIKITEFPIRNLKVLDIPKTKINLIYQKTQENENRISKLTHLNDQKFIPTLFLYHSFLQSVYNVKSKKNIDISFVREYVKLKDMGQISLDWALPLRKIFRENNKENNKENNENIDENNENIENNEKIVFSGNYHDHYFLDYEPGIDNKIMFILHGLTGGSEMPYVRYLVHEAQKKGYRVAVLHNRGINGTKLSTPVPFEGIQLDDIEQGIHFIKTKYPNAPIIGVGLSMGGNQLIRYAAKKQKNVEFKGMICLAAPYDVLMCAENLNILYENFFIKRYIENTIIPNLNELKVLEKTLNIDFEDLKKTNRLKDFHSKFTIKIFNFNSVEEYFSKAKIYEEHLINIQIPTLLMHSKDDPITVRKCIPFDLFEKNKNIIFAETYTGGHICWFSGLKPQRWYPKPTLEFAECILNE